MSKPKCPLLGVKPLTRYTILLSDEAIAALEEMAESASQAGNRFGGAVLTAALKLKKASGKPTKTSR